MGERGTRRRRANVGGQPRATKGKKANNKQHSDDEADEIEEQTTRQKQREEEKVRADIAAIKAKASEDARVNKRVSEEMASKRDFDIRMALATMGVQRVEEALAAVKAGLRPGEKAVEGNTWGAGFQNEAGAAGGGRTDNLNTNREQEGQGSNVNIPGLQNPDTDSHTLNSTNVFGQQGRGTN